MKGQIVLQYENLAEQLKAIGATRSAYLAVDAIPFQPSLRKYCENNLCGNYGQNYMCPPLVGSVDELIETAKSFDNGLIFQLVSPLEDSFDLEGMEAAAENFENLTQRTAEWARKTLPGKFLLLGAGGCRQCKQCAAQSKEPCRHPDRAFSSLEAYGIQVASLLAKVNIPYINGENTVSYAGIVLF